ncbi:MAG: PEP-CTERM sorting domain-containing protein [Nitrospirales bacterium]
MYQIRCFRLSCLLFAMAVILTSLSPAQAALITFDFTGTIQRVGSSFGFFPPFRSSDSVKGSFTFESTTPDALPTSSTIGQYGGAVKSLNFMFGSYSGGMAAGNDGVLQVQNNTAGRDSFLVRTGFGAENLDGPPVNGLLPKDFFLRVFDNTQAMVNSVDLPTTPPTIWQNNNASTTFIILGFPGGGINTQVRATVDSLTLAAVPTPSSLLLMGTGLVGLILFRRRQDHTQRISQSKVQDERM